MKLVANPTEKICSQCFGGATKMVQLIRTKTFICPICSSLDYYTPNQNPQSEQQEYIIDDQ